MSVIPLKVAVRVRPLIQKEKEKRCKTCLSFIPDEPQIVLGKDQSFTFDFVFRPTDTQLTVFEDAIKPLTEHIFKGYNATVLAYGQTGSGKTFTMGGGYEDSLKMDPEGMGIIPRIVQEIFLTIAVKEKYKYKTHVSYLEIINEDLQDLLVSGKKESLTIRKENGVIKLPGLREIAVSSTEEVMKYLVQGCNNRTTAATAMNNTSSRSHAVFSLMIEQHNEEDTNDFWKVKLQLVDLAGSDQFKQTPSEGARLNEGININKSLLALSNVIRILGDKTKKALFVPYRDSKLTRILQNSLGGNSHILLIACVSPADSNMEETLNTLRYAVGAKKIKNKPVVELLDSKTAENMRLKEQVQQLTMKLNSAGLTELDSENDLNNPKQEQMWRDKCQKFEAEVESLHKQILSVNQAAASATRAQKWENKWDRLKVLLEDLGNTIGVVFDLLSSSITDPAVAEQVEKLKNLFSKLQEFMGRQGEPDPTDPTENTDVDIEEEEALEGFDTNDESVKRTKSEESSSPESACTEDSGSSLCAMMSAFQPWSPSVTSAMKDGKVLPAPPAIMREGFAGTAPSYLHSGPPVLLHPDKVVPHSDSTRYEPNYAPNVSLASPSQGGDELRLSPTTENQRALEIELEMIRQALDGKIGDVKEEKDRFLHEFCKLRAKHQELLNRNIRARKNLKQANSKLTEPLEQAQVQLKQQPASVHTMQAIMEAKDSRISALEKELQSLEDKVHRLGEDGGQDLDSSLKREMLPGREKALKSEIESLKTEVSSRDNEIIALKMKVDTLTNQESEHQHYINVLKDQIKSKDQQSTMFNADANSKLTEQLEQAQVQLKQQPASVHTMQAIMEAKDSRISALEKELQSLEDKVHRLGEDGGQDLDSSLKREMLPGREKALKSERSIASRSVLQLIQAQSIENVQGPPMKKSASKQRNKKCFQYDRSYYPPTSLKKNEDALEGKKYTYKNKLRSSGRYQLPHDVTDTNDDEEESEEEPKKAKKKTRTSKTNLVTVESEECIADTPKAATVKPIRKKPSKFNIHKLDSETVLQL